MRAAAGDCKNAIEKQRDEASLRLSIPLERLLPGDFCAGADVPVPYGDLVKIRAFEVLR